MRNKMSETTTRVLLAVCLVMAPWAASRAAVAVTAGYDLLETCNAAGATFDDLTLETCPIPGNLFGPGCNNFSGTIQFRGEPLRGFDFGSGMVGVGTADTIIQREQNAGPAFPATINIELVALNLVSVAPITVTGCTGGNQQWTVRAVDAPGNALTNSTMTIAGEHANGGTFTSTLHVCPRLMFTRVPNPGWTITLDPCSAVGPQCEVELGTNLGAGTTAAWSHNAPQIGDLATIPGATTNFVPGAVAGAGGTQNACPVGGRDPDAKQVEDKAVQILGAAAHPATAAGGPRDTDGDLDTDGCPVGLPLSACQIIVPATTPVGLAVLAVLLMIGVYFLLRRRALA